MKTQTVMRSWGTVHGDLTYSGQYLKAFDFEAHDGRGEITMTPNVEEALHFDSIAEAWEFWKRQPKCKPMRDYGDRGPNRPLTATNWEFASVPVKADA